MTSLTLIFVLFVLVVTSVFLTLLLIPLPKFILRIVISLLSKLNSPILSWPVRVSAVLLIILTANAVFELYKYQNREEPTDVLGRKDFTMHRFRVERNFYLHIMTFAVVLVTWRVQAIVKNAKNLEADIEMMRSDNEKLKKQY